MRISENAEEDYMNEDDAKRTILLFQKIFKEVGLKYWVDYGTLLGTIRENSFIPYDTDIEIYVKYEDFDFHIKEMLHRLYYYGFKLEVLPMEVHIKQKEGYVGSTIGWFKEGRKISSWFFYHLPGFIRKSFIKLMMKIYFSSTNEVVRPDDGEDREKKWHCRWIRSFLPTFFCYKLMEWPFYNFTVSVPVKAKELLYLRYGKDWIIPKKRYKSYTT